ncbi:TPA: hypothetical protein L3645_006144 [Pseudomonas aeruginosa]|nr:hypothetical protein [Pseudomonas aeruginosa]
MDPSGAAGEHLVPFTSFEQLPELILGIHGLSSTFEVRVDNPSFALAGHGHRPFAKGIKRMPARELSGQVVAGNAENVSHGCFPITQRV